jgi:hypothetical protein
MNHHLYHNSNGVVVVCHTKKQYILWKPSETIIRTAYPEGMHVYQIVLSLVYPDIVPEGMIWTKAQHARMSRKIVYDIDSNMFIVKADPYTWNKIAYIGNIHSDPEGKQRAHFKNKWGIMRRALIGTGGVGSAALASWMLLKHIKRKDTHQMHSKEPTVNSEVPIKSENESKEMICETCNLEFFVNNPDITEGSSEKVKKLMNIYAKDIFYFIVKDICAMHPFEQAMKKVNAHPFVNDELKKEWIQNIETFKANFKNYIKDVTNGNFKEISSSNKGSQSIQNANHWVQAIRNVEQIVKKMNNALVYLPQS